MWRARCPPRAWDVTHLSSATEWRGNGGPRLSELEAVQRIRSRNYYFRGMGRYAQIYWIKSSFRNWKPARPGRHGYRTRFLDITSKHWSANHEPRTRLVPCYK